MRKFKARRFRFLLSAIIILFVFACGGGGGSDSADNSTPTAPTPAPVPTPAYTPSEDQVKLIADEGTPEYLTIAVSSENGRREESWVYTRLGKMYIFWDGTRVKEQVIDIDPSDYSKPPYIDPTLFDSQTTKQDIMNSFGTNYTLIDQSEGGLSFETWFFADAGIAVSFSDDELVGVQTIDKP